MPYVYGGQNAFAGGGLGTPLQNAGIPVNGAAGTFANANIGKGALLNDITNGVMYENQGTAASPTWVKISGT